MLTPLLIFFFFFFNDTATTEIYTLSLHDALPISKPFQFTAGTAIRPKGFPRTHSLSSLAQSPTRIGWLAWWSATSAALSSPELISCATESAPRDGHWIVTRIGRKPVSRASSPRATSAAVR